MSKDATQAGQADTGEETGEPGQTGDAGTGTANNAGTADTGAASVKSGKALTMTQEELDAIIERRLAKERRDNASIADKAARWDAHEAESATEAEKAEAKQKAREEVIAKRESEANAKLLLAETLVAVRAASVEPEFEDLVVQAIIQAEDVEIDEKGQVAGVESALKKLLKASPKLTAENKPAAPGAQGGEFTGQGGGPSVDEQIAEKLKQGGRGVVDAVGLKLSRHRTAPSG